MGSCLGGEERCVLSPVVGPALFVPLPDNIPEPQALAASLAGWVGRRVGASVPPASRRGALLGPRTVREL